MIRSYYDVITISMLSAVISVSPDIFTLQWLTVLLHYGHSWIGFYCGVAVYHFLLLIPSTEVCQERVGSLLSELIYALVGKTLPMAAKCPLMSQRENISHTA